MSRDAAPQRGGVDAQAVPPADPGVRRDHLRSERRGAFGRFLGPSRAAALVSVPLGAIYLVDEVIRRWPPRHTLPLAVLDETAHLSTAVLVIVAACGVRSLIVSRRAVIVALAAAVLIDVDHLPAMLGSSVVTEGTPRPYSHSILTPVALVLLAAVLGRLRPMLLAAAAGVALHFVRDIATGPGLSLWLPLSTHAVRLPYPPYAVLVAVAAAVAAVRVWRELR